MSALLPIVIVDHNHDDLFILKRLLARSGICNPLVTFDHAEDAARFLDAAIRTPDTNLLPAAILSDMRMSGMSGFEILAWIRQQPALANTPFFLFSSAVDADTRERAMQLGATRFREKFPPEHVVAELLRVRVYPDHDYDATTAVRGVPWMAMIGIRSIAPPGIRAVPRFLRLNKKRRSRPALLSIAKMPGSILPADRSTHARRRAPVAFFPKTGRIKSSSC